MATTFDDGDCYQDLVCPSGQDCIITTTVKQCWQGYTIDASAATNLFITATEEKEAFKLATINLPNTGDATLTQSGSSTKAFREAIITAGTNTQNIIIDCADSDTANYDDCKSIQVDAQTAQYLEVNFPNGGSRSDANNDPSNFWCPVGSLYNGPEKAPCVINLSGTVNIAYTRFYTANGMPQDLWIEGYDTTTFADRALARVYCNPTGNNEIFQLIANQLSTSGTCWITPEPTESPTSKAPSKSPSKAPSKSPSTAPTSGTTQTPTDATPGPSKQPSQSPSTSPSKTPSESPSESPSKGPSNSPSTNPSKAPSTPPTLPSTAPSKTPSQSPSTSPSKFPTNSPTDGTIINVTPKPTKSPTFGDGVAVNEPSFSPTNAPVIGGNFVAGGAEGMDPLILVMIIGISALICCFCGCGLFGIYKYNTMKAEKDSEIIRIQSDTQFQKINSMSGISPPSVDGFRVSTGPKYTNTNSPWMIPNGPGRGPAISTTIEMTEGTGNYYSSQNMGVGSDALPEGNGASTQEMDLAEAHDEAMGVSYANNDNVIDDNEDITPEDYMETPMGDVDTDDDMDVIGGMNTPFGGPNPEPFGMQIPPADIDGIDDIENVNDNGNEQEDNMMANEINNAVTAGGDMDDVDDLMNENDQEIEDVDNMVVNDLNSGNVTAGGDIMPDIDMNEGTDDEGSNDDYALEDDLIIDDDHGITIIDNEDAMKAKQYQKQEEFGQMLGDDVMAQDMVMDDIVSEMNVSSMHGNDGPLAGSQEESDDDLLAGMDTAQ